MGGNIVSPKTELLSYHQDFQVYFSYDTHWNQLGAYIGVKKVLNLWNIEIPPIESRIILKKDLKGNYHYGASDDLAKIVGLLSVFDDEVEYEIEGTLAIDWTQFETEQESRQISHFENPSAENDGTLLLIGDSFRISMVPALLEAYQNVYVIDKSYYEPGMLDIIHPDYVIAEYIERASRSIADIDDLFFGFE